VEIVPLIEGVIALALILLVAFPSAAGAALAIGDSRANGWLLVAETFTPARLQTLAAVAFRAAALASACVVVGTPIGVLLATARGRIDAFAVIALLSLPFFVSDAVKSFAWADIFRAAAGVCRTAFDQPTRGGCGVLSP
jgi:ABC-type spermidine/putrescine transport system permease subunit I